MLSMPARTVTALVAVLALLSVAAPAVAASTSIVVDPRVQQTCDGATCRLTVTCVVVTTEAATQVRVDRCEETSSGLDAGDGAAEPGSTSVRAASAVVAPVHDATVCYDVSASFGIFARIEDTAACVSRNVDHPATVAYAQHHWTLTASVRETCSGGVCTTTLTCAVTLPEQPPDSFRYYQPLVVGDGGCTEPVSGATGTTIYYLVKPAPFHPATVVGAASRRGPSRNSAEVCFQFSARYTSTSMPYKSSHISSRDFYGDETECLRVSLGTPSTVRFDFSGERLP